MKKRLMLSVAALVVGLLAYWQLRTPTAAVEYQVPAGFSGWITIKHDVPGAPAIPTHQYRIPESGILETSSPRVRAGKTRFFRSERGGAVLVVWVPAPSTVRERHTVRCTRIYVSPSALAPGEDPPAPPEHGCD